jgi:hypothetical protein
VDTCFSILALVFIIHQEDKELNYKIILDVGHFLDAFKII